MSEGLKARFDFPSPIIQAQTVRTLVAAVLKEKAPNERISAQGAAMGALWEQCCSDCAPVRSACCDALVLLVEQGHADLQHTMDTVLNRMPSARNVQGLIKVTGRLLQMQADQRDPGAPYTCPYSIRGSPHPYITALENRVDCWPVLLLEIEDYVQEAVDRDEPVYVDMLAPFLRYLYCQPQRPAQQALLRRGLLGVLLPAPGGEGSPPAPSPRVSERLLRCLYDMVPHMQVDGVEAVLELHGFLQTLLPAVVARSGAAAAAPVPAGAGHGWKAEGARLALQLLCACHVSLRLDGSCGPPVGLLRQLLPACKEELPVEELLVGLSLLLLEASAPQQTSLLTLALSLVPEDSERCPWGTPVLTLPLLQMLACSALTEPLADPRTHRRNHGLAHSLLRSTQKPTQSYTGGGVCLSSPLSAWYSEVRAVVRVLRRVLGSASAASDWLLSVTSSLTTSSSSSGGGPPRPPAALGLVVAHLVVGGAPDVCRLALRAARAIGVADPSQVPSLLPVLLFRLGKESDPSVCHALLSSLPHLGTHKLCVPQVLHVLQMLASDPKLRAVAMRLMTALWVKQDRVYPDLQRVLLGQQEKWSVVLGKDTQWELILARAACIRDICTERPYQHGGDMLAAIVHTLSQNTRPDLASPAALALQGLTQLCRAEVVDMVSTWRALGPKLSCDRRPLVVKAVSELLALVQQLATKSQDYQKLKEEVVSFLWSYALSKDCEVSSCGYRALASFPEEAHTVLHLPEPARPEVKLPTDEEEEEEKEKEEDLSVPGTSYVKLLTLTPSPVLPALETFVASLVRQEMERMPRGVYHSALRGAGLRSDQGKTLAGVPAFMLKTYEKNKQPGLKPGLAAGLLLSYDLPVQTDRDGRPIPRFLLGRSRSFQQTLTALIHEVNIQPSEWHRALLLPQAWRAFMNRAFHAVLQGRRGELEMQQKQGKESPEDLQYKHHCAWLWARDQLTDVMESAAKDSPVVQGNSILALSGLAAVVAKYESNLPLDSDGSLGVGPEVVPTSSWLSMVLDTLLSVINSSYKARGQVFPWFLHRSYSGENTASAIARSCAALALCLVVPALSGWHGGEGVAEALGTLRAGLPGQPAAGADGSQAVQFHSGLALGLVLSSMHRERLSEVSAQKDADLLTTSLDSLESCSFDPSLEYNAGCVLGMGLVLGSLSGSAQSAHGARVVLALDKLLVSLRDSGGQGRVLQEVLSYSVACVAVWAFAAGLVDSGRAEEVMNTLRGLTEDNQQTPGFSLSLGLVVHGLAACGHGKAEDIHPRLLAAWIKILLAEGCPTMQRLAAVNGLVSLVGSESYVIQLKTEAELSPQQQGRLNEVIRSMTQIISFSGALGLQSNSACLVGHLHLAHMTCSHSHTAVPQDFSYLPENSVIRAIVHYVSEAGKKGPEYARPGVVRVALACLASVGSSFQYPPVNWSAILSPLMRLNFGPDTRHQCAVLAASQVQTSQSASLFLGSWLSPPLVHSLSCETRGRLYESLSTWMKHVSEDKLQVFVESQGVALFQDDTRGAQQGSLCRALLRGLAQAMALPNPPSAVWAVLRSTAEKIFGLLPERVQDSDVELYEGITKCLSELPDTEIDRITQVTQTNMEKSCMVLTFLTSRGRVPLLGLNDVIAAVLRGWPSRGVGGLLAHTFYQCRLASSGPNTGVSKRMEWLLELMGHIRNIVYGATSVQCSTTQATDFLLRVFAGAVAAWGDHAMPLLLGMRASWSPWEEEEEEEEAGGSKPPCLLPHHHLYGEEETLAETPLSPNGEEESHLSLCLLGLSHSLPRLLRKEPWSGQLNKFIDWLFSLVESPEECWSAASISTVRAALLSLRSCAEFQKKAVWTRAYGW